MADDGLREIQLSAKQLIALFMAAAVLLVATFLCGVLVGRGVRAQKEPTLSAAGESPSAPATEDPAVAAALQPSAGTGPAAAPPPQPEEDLTYYKSLEGQKAPAETTRPLPAAPRAEPPVTPAAAAPVAPPPASRSAPAAPVQAAATRPASASPARPVAAAPDPDPAGGGYVVKIVAYRDRAQSEALAARLTAKGYAAFVATVAGRGPSLYSVRVGKFKSRAEAEAAKTRLEKEEQFKPLVTR